MNEYRWAKYCGWFTARNVTPPSYFTDYILVADRKAPDRILACCLIYATDGPYAVVEHAAFDPDIPLREGYEAMLFGAKQIAAYGAMRKKTMLCFPSTRGMALMLRRAGFEMLSTPVMRHGPWST